MKTVAVAAIRVVLVVGEKTKNDDYDGGSDDDGNVKEHGLRSTCVYRNQSNVAADRTSRVAEKAGATVTTTTFNIMTGMAKEYADDVLMATSFICTTRTNEATDETDVRDGDGKH